MEGGADDARDQRAPIWDAAPAQRFVTYILSCIFYARGAFPEECFRRVSDYEWDHPYTTHESLLNSGMPLSSSATLKESIFSQNGPFIYLRRSQNSRLDGFLGALDGILAAVQHQRLGKIQVCFSRSKSWEPDALIEFYGLKFRYTKGGSLYVYINWGGIFDTTIPTHHGNTFNEFLRVRPPIIGTYYTHPFIYSTDGKPLDKKVDPGLGRFIRKAVSLLQDKSHSGGSRIGTLVYHSEADIRRDDGEKSLIEERVRHQEVYSTKQAPAVGSKLSISSPQIEQVPIEGPDGFFEQEQSSDWVVDSDTCSATDLASQERLRLGKAGENWRARLDNMLSVFEEPSDELPSTQLLSPQQPSSQQLKRRRGSLIDHLQPYGQSQPSQSMFKPRHTERFNRCSPTTIRSRLDASQLEPPSSA